METLARKVVFGGLWALGLRFSGRLLGFLRTLILARLLFPQDFGLIGLAMAVMMAVECFSQMGFQQALIQEKEDSRPYLDTAWSVLLVRSCLLFAGLLAAAPAVAEFFRAPELSPIIRVIALSILISGFANIGILFFQKDLDFRRQFVFDLTASLVDVIVSVSLAFLLRDVWALVWGGLAGNLTRVLLSYRLHPYRPRLRFEWAHLRQLFRFGQWMFAYGIIGYLMTQTDTLLIGRALGPAALGLYQIAALVALLPASEFALVVSQVLFPSYARLQDDPVRLGEAYERVLQLMGLVCIPLAVGIGMLAPEFVGAVLGGKWIPAVLLLQILCILGLARSLEATTSTLLLGIGRPREVFLFSFLQLVILLALIVPSVDRWGLPGVAAAVAAASVAVNALSFRRALSLVGLRFTRVLMRFAAPLLAAIVMASALLLLKTFTFAGLAGFIGLAVSAALVYGAALFAVDALFAASQIRQAMEELLGAFLARKGIEPSAAVSVHAGANPIQDRQA
jgi:lipopolysaccharide exporter